MHPCRTVRRWCVPALVLCVLLAGCAKNRSVARRDDPEGLIQQARQADSQGDRQSAEQFYAAAIRQNPRDCETRLELSEMLLEHGSLEAATIHLRQIVAENPDDPRGYVRLAQALYLQRNYRAAERLVETALEMDARHPQGLILQGRLAELRGQDEQALEAYHQVLTLAPELPEAKLHVASLYLQRGESQLAAPLLRSLVEGREGCVEQRTEASWLLGVAYMREERWADAVPHLEAGFGPGRNGSEEWYQLAYARYRTGDWSGASQAVNVVINLTPLDSRAQSLRRQLDGQGPVAVVGGTARGS